MLSNLLVKSNLLPSTTYQEAFEVLPAMDLRSIHERCRMLNISFDPSRHTLTERQWKEWDARLFWGDKTVSWSQENRKTHWIITLGGTCVKDWKQIHQNMNKETAFEWLWILETCKYINQPPAGSRKIIIQLREFLHQHSYTDKDIDERLNSFYPEYSER